MFEPTPKDPDTLTKIPGALMIDFAIWSILIVNFFLLKNNLLQANLLKI